VYADTNMLKLTVVTKEMVSSCLDVFGIEKIYIHTYIYV